jgi:DNA-binding NarL/FixJ family response regulator
MVADNYNLRRQGLVSLLRTKPEFEVIGECSEGSDLLKIPANVIPDVVLIEITFPTIDSIDPISLIRQRNANQKILVLSDSALPANAIKTFRGGALGYFVRMEDLECLTQAINTVFRGHRYLSKIIEDQILDSIVTGDGMETGNDNRISSREREILKLIAEGKTNAEIGKLLVISTRTVETHRTNLMRKLGLSSQGDIIRYAIKNGLISIE